MYISGAQVYITILDPNLLLQTREVRVSSDGVFDFQKVVDESVINGTYTVSANYRDKNSHEITLDIQFEGR